MESNNQDILNNSYKTVGNNYLLYSRKNPLVAQYLVLGNLNSIKNSNFDPAKETVIFAPGWRDDGRSKTCRSITEAFLENKDVNMIQLDWSYIGNRNYMTAKRGTPEAGRSLGTFILWLTNFGLQLKKVHLVGYSLGAHLVGFAGRTTGGRVQRITALDPARPLWIFDRNRIKKTDGRYVEVIHTNTAFLGISTPCGDADFYPNGGCCMPGFFVNCKGSHNHAVKYMIMTVKYNNFWANQCKNLKQMYRNKNLGALYPMGNSDLNKSQSGIFRINTGKYYFSNENLNSEFN